MLTLLFNKTRWNYWETPDKYLIVVTRYLTLILWLVLIVVIRHLKIPKSEMLNQWCKRRFGGRNVVTENSRLLLLSTLVKLISTSFRGYTRGPKIRGRSVNSRHVRQDYISTRTKIKDVPEGRYKWPLFLFRLVLGRPGTVTFNCYIWTGYTTSIKIHGKEGGYHTL